MISYVGCTRLSLRELSESLVVVRKSNRRTVLVAGIDGGGSATMFGDGGCQETQRQDEERRSDRREPFAEANLLLNLAAAAGKKLRGRSVKLLLP